MTVVVAPAGGGKTTGVAGWLWRTGRVEDATWLAGSAELGVEVLDGCLPPGRDDVSDDDGDRDETPALVVIDDAHLLPPASLAYLGHRLEHEPDRMRVVLLSRWDLPIPRLVPELLGELTVLRGDLLRLEDDEVAALVLAHAGTEDPEVVAAIAGLARGWPAAVVLAARTISTAADPVAAARRLPTLPGILDGLLSEVFAALPSTQRHLLLCVADEPVLTGELACRLSGRSDAAELLMQMEATGLLVTRMAVVASGKQTFDAGAAVVDTFHVHPLLAEVARRRFSAGGVDVERARAVVRRAVAVDASRGDFSQALQRLAFIGAIGEAADLLAERGVALVLTGAGSVVRSFARGHSEVVQANRGCWLAVGLERWLEGDAAGARRWLDTMDPRPPALPSSSAPSVGSGSDGADADGLASLHAVCARLMCARLGEGRLGEVAAESAVVLDAFDGMLGHDGTGAVQAWARVQLGAAFLHLGELAQAEDSLERATALARNHGLSAVLTTATAGLALAHFLEGREDVCLDLVGQVSHVRPDAAHAPTGELGLLLARDLGLAQKATHGRQREDGLLGPVQVPIGPQHPADRTSAGLATLLASRRLLLQLRVAEAEHALAGLAHRRDLPPVLRVVVLVEQALHAALAADGDRLATLERELGWAGHSETAAFVAALRADIAGKRTDAIDRLNQAVHARVGQPPVAAMAHCMRAQLLHAQGDVDVAHADLRAALAGTASRETLLPFLGWSRQGTPVATLIAEIADDRLPTRAAEVLRQLEETPGDLATSAGLVTATARERLIARSEDLTFNLSPREREVLHELARGATYSDIAAALYVSENTVKTHISSLYGKLGAGRRGEALATARTKGLI